MDLKDFLEGKEWKLYNLIWCRAVASQMKPSAHRHVSTPPALTPLAPLFPPYPFFLLDHSLFLVLFLSLLKLYHSHPSAVPSVPSAPLTFMLILRGEQVSAEFADRASDPTLLLSASASAVQFPGYLRVYKVSAHCSRDRTPSGHDQVPTWSCTMWVFTALVILGCPRPPEVCKGSGAAAWGPTARGCRICLHAPCASGLGF